MYHRSMPDEEKRPNEEKREEKREPPGRDGPPMNEPAAGGQYYFPGREQGCLGVLLVFAALAAVLSATR
jgi:hypothetical protein